jgi:hypothetical protein
MALLTTPITPILKWPISNGHRNLRLSPPTLITAILKWAIFYLPRINGYFLPTPVRQLHLCLKWPIPNNKSINNLFNALIYHVLSLYSTYLIRTSFKNDPFLTPNQLIYIQRSHYIIASRHALSTSFGPIYTHVPISPSHHHAVTLNIALAHSHCRLIPRARLISEPTPPLSPHFPRRIPWLLAPIITTLDTYNTPGCRHSRIDCKWTAAFHTRNNHWMGHIWSAGVPVATSLSVIHCRAGSGPRTGINHAGHRIHAVYKTSIVPSIIGPVVVKIRPRWQFLDILPELPLGRPVSHGLTVGTG